MCCGGVVVVYVVTVFVSVVVVFVCRGCYVAVRCVYYDIVVVCTNADVGYVYVVVVCDCVVIHIVVVYFVLRCVVAVCVICVCVVIVV